MRSRRLLPLLLLTVLACGRNDEAPRSDAPVFGPGPRRVIVICLDSLRGDHLGCHGYGRDTSPRMDALAAKGARFARATAPTNWTLPSHASFFTGLFNKGHGVRREDQALGEDVPSLMEPLLAAGFATAAYTGGAFMTQTYGLHRGFELWWSSEKETGQWGNILRHGLDWLREHPAEDIFLFLHTYEIHAPYMPPPRETREILGYHRTKISANIRELEKHRFGRPDDETATEIVGLYDAGIRYTDRLLGAFLDDLAEEGLDENLLLIVTSDHGESFWEHGGWGHNGDLLGPQITDVPLIVTLPGGAAPREAVVETEVSFMDILPTVLDAAGLEPDNDIDGFSLLPELVGRPVSPADEAARARRSVRVDGREVLTGFCEARRFTWTRAGGRSVVRPGPLGDDETRDAPVAVYDLDADPWELSPRLPTDALDAALDAAAEALAGRPGDETRTPPTIQIDPRMRRNLEALGYL